MKDKPEDEYQKQSAFMETIKLALRGHESKIDMLAQTKFFTIITLNQILCQLIQNIIGTADTEQTNKSISIILRSVLSILSDQMKQGQDSNVMNEYMTELFSSIVEKVHKINSELLKPYKKDVTELFNSDSFFMLNKLNLKQWQKIMRFFIDGRPEEFFEEQMTKWNFQGGLFANNQYIES